VDAFSSEMELPGNDSVFLSKSTLVELNIYPWCFLTHPVVGICD